MCPPSTSRRTSVSKPTPTLVVYKEIVEADLLKLQAQSNITSSGGGARDLRLPANTFRDPMNRIFARQVVTSRGKVIRAADVVYLDTQGRPKSTVLEYWPPTNSRPREDRVSKVHASPALGGQLPTPNNGRVLVLFMLFSDGTVRCDYAYENDLRSGKWARELASAILECMRAADLKNVHRKSSLVSVQGYYDFEDGAHYCHAD